MWRSRTSSFAILLLLVVIASGEVLLKKGWYKTHLKGPKTVLTNVEYIDNKIVSNPTYLRVNARIPTLFRGSIRNLHKLILLKLPFCAIFDIEPGAFQNLPNLATLGLLDNEIRHIRNGVFNNLNISTLYLQRNQIESIDSQAFNDMPNLHRLKINANKISAWDGDWFRNSPALTEILFRRNEIANIPSNAFRNIKGSHVKNDTYVVDTKIYLSKNNISSVHPDALKGLEEVSQLWLDRNLIYEVDSKVFSHITQIGALFLSKNKLRSLPEDMFPKLNTEIDIFDLASNNNMTCLSYKIVSKVKLTNIQDIRRLDCKCVDNLVKRLKDDKKPNEIKTDCQNSEEQ